MANWLYSMKIALEKIMKKKKGPFEIKPGEYLCVYYSTGYFTNFE